MALSIKDPEADRLARELADRTGETLTEAVTTALRERLDRVGYAQEKRSLADQLNEIALRCASLPVYDDRTPDEIIGYDENGLPFLMVIDSSAIVAILRNEPERPAFNQMIEDAAHTVIAAPVYLEAGIVIETRNRDIGAREFDLFFVTSGIEVIPFDRDLAEVARLAFRLYGKGRHRAALNFGDCISYALAKTRNEPLLCKGDDFPQTDIRIA